MGKLMRSQRVVYAYQYIFTLYLWHTLWHFHESNLQKVQARPTLQCFTNDKYLIFLDISFFQLCFLWSLPDAPRRLYNWQWICLKSFKSPPMAAGQKTTEVVYCLVTPMFKAQRFQTWDSVQRVGHRQPHIYPNVWISSYYQVRLVIYLQR